jgi:hypothetical protein
VAHSDFRGSSMPFASPALGWARNGAAYGEEAAG